MRIRRGGLKKARIEIIPMIDTIFFLLVFFMISTLSMAHYRGLSVSLPKAASGQQPPAEGVSITITRDGGLFLNKEPIEKQKLVHFLRLQLQQNPELLVILNADHGVSHGEVIEVMDQARQAGVARLSIAVEPKEKRHER
ncbi:MAG: biopolymer transporter ExbD [Deltaproteobacteria bacterium]|nr:biopolymer transporter ExbD [Deltaproteobacteria bacterium]